MVTLHAHVTQLSQTAHTFHTGYMSAQEMTSERTQV